MMKQRNGHFDLIDLTQNFKHLYISFELKAPEMLLAILPSRNDGGT